MTKIIIILLSLYIVYYAVNIVYDLFLKRDITLKKEDNDEFALLDFGEQNINNVVNIGIEDVENLKTPKSFNTKQFSIETESNNERDLEHWRERFESEENIDSFDSDPALLENNEDRCEKENKVDLEDEFEFSVEIDDNVQSTAESDELNFIKVSNSEIWNNIVAMSETMVQVLENINGCKVYNSSLI